MDNLSEGLKANGGDKDSGPLIDVSSNNPSPVATISPNTVRNRIGAAPAPAVGSAQKKLSPLIGSPVTSLPSPFVPGNIHRVTASEMSSKSASSPPQSVIERHLVRRNYEELSHSKRQTTVGSRLAADVSPDGSTAGDLENLDSLSLKLSPNLSRRSTAPIFDTSSTVPSTPLKLPSHQREPDLLSLQGDFQTKHIDELSDAALQFQAELKRTLESSNSTYSSLIDISAPVTKWKRAMSLPQNDFSRAMCHRAVAKTLAQNIRSTLKSSPSTIKESLVSTEDQPPPPYVEEVAPKLSQPASGRLISPIGSPAFSNKRDHHVIENNIKEDAEDIWILRESYVDKLEDMDRHWKSQQVIEEQYERHLQTEVTRRMAEFATSRKDASGEVVEAGAVVASLSSRKSSDDSASVGEVTKRRLSNSSNNSIEPSSSLSFTGANEPLSRYGNKASGYYHRPGPHTSTKGHYMQQHDEELSDYSDNEDGESQPSLLRPFSNFLAGRKGAYSKVPTLTEPRHQPKSNRHQAKQFPEGRQSLGDRQLKNSSSNGGRAEPVEYSVEEAPPVRRNPEEYDTDEETDKLLEKGYQSQRQVQFPELAEHALSDNRKKVSMKEVQLADPDQPSVLLEGVLFRCRYLGSTQLVSESQPSKSIRMMQAQEAVGRIKAPFGEAQPSTEVDLFISFEKVMVLSTNLQDIIMDHALKTISYVADLDDVVVLMTRRRQLPDSNPSGLTSSSRGPQIKMLCHVFECEDAHHISDAIGEAFHLAYMSFLRANGIEDPTALRDVGMDEENIGPQDIFNDDLPRFVDKNHQRDVVISKARGEALGIVVVESGWGSVIPTVVVANMLPTGPAARSGQLNIGDQLLSINGISLVGLPMTSCQNYIKAAKTQTAVRITLIRCPPVTEVLIKRPDIKYQLGFSVHNGIICSLLRGGIAERGGVRVGHRIIEVNGESVVAVSHERIVNLLSSSVGEIRMKTMPMSIFRLLTGQDAPNYI